MKRKLPVLLATTLLAFCTVSTRAVLDLDSDGLPDVWQQKHAAASLPPAADADGDGQSNEVEAAAGTDPFKPGDYIRITSSEVKTDGAHLVFPSVAGKRYQAETCAELGAPWTSVGPFLPGVNGTLSAIVPVSGNRAYFRVRVAEVDTDNDGLTDWEELQVGLNPNSPNTDGPYQPGDFARLTTSLQSQSTVHIVAETADASEAGPRAGVFTIRRTGSVGPVTVPLFVSGSAMPGSDYVALPSSITLGLGENFVSFAVTPLADTLLESDENVTVTLGTPSSGNLGNATATVLIADDAQANGTGLAAQFYNETSAMTDSNGPTFASVVVSRIDALVDYSWPSTTEKGVASPSPLINTDYFASRWTGEILPEFSQAYTFKLLGNRACRLWVNGQLIINNWPGNGGSGSVSGTYTGLADLVAGKRTPIVLEHFDTTGSGEMRLRWSSSSQVEQVIPTARLFPTPPPQLLGETQFVFLKNGPAVSLPLSASGSPTAFSATNLPPGWSIHTGTGLISGNPTTAGVWEVAVTASNAYGMGAAVLRIEVAETGGGLTSETWLSVSSLASLPLETAPANTSTVTSFETAPSTDSGIGQRLRGYLTAPETGTYRFWLTGDDQAELWISNDSETVNLFRRSRLAAATGLRAWASAPPSDLLWLEAGKRYYVELRHFDPSGPGHASVGWLKPSQGGADPMAATAPAEVIPGHALSPAVSPAPVPGEASLYTARLLPAPGASTGAFGTGSVSLASTETAAAVRLAVGNLTSAQTFAKIVSAAHSDAVLFTLSPATLQTDGSHLWTIAAAGALSPADVVGVIRSGQADLVVSSTNYPLGEIRGALRFQPASAGFTAPAPAPSWPSDHADRAAAVRFLTQATFGPDEASIASVQSLGYAAWIDQQLGLPPTQHYPLVYANRNVTNPQSPTYNGTNLFNTWWRQSLTAPDQLRQRVAFALSQILVVSEAGPLDDRADAISTYYDLLLEHSFGNFRTLLEEVTLNPAMGRYLDMLRNERPNRASGRIPNENYAREILQLFSIGLYRMHPDGSLVLDSKGQPIPTYGQEEVIGFSHAFTGWNYNQPDSGAYKPTSWSPSSDWLNPMREVPGRHDIGPKRILNNVMLPGLPKVVTTTAASPTTPVTIVLNPDTDYSSNADVRQSVSFQNLAREELAATHDAIFHHPNVGPFLCRQLIQRLVTSSPSPGYVYRVSSVFNDNGSGVRGDLGAVVKAILLDHEARSTEVLARAGYGKQREPLLRVTALARAFPEPAALSGTYQQTDNAISVTTSAPHLLVSGNPVVLSFGSGSAKPSDGSYTLSSSFPISANAFSVRPKEVVNVSANQSGSTVTVTSSAHGLPNGMRVFLRFPAGLPAQDSYLISYVDSNTFTFTAPDTADRTGLVGFYVLHKGGYTMAANSPIVTVTCGTRHRLATGDSAYLHFYPVSGQTTAPTAGVYPVTVVNDTVFTFTNPGTFTSSRSGTFAMSPLSPVLSFSGNLAGTFRSYAMNDTETDLAQTPLRSPTVFNFYLPDYQFPGAIASAGLTTPEFELSSETNLMRQNNLLSSAIHNPTSSTTLYSSFRSGNGVLGMDFSPWMGVKPGGSSLWTDNANLPALVQELSVLLTAGRLPPEAATVIQNHAATTSYTASAPTQQQRRDRVRTIIHLIATSPDFAIQR